jgi:acid phosphatase
MYFRSIRGNAALCKRDAPFTQFASDLSSGAAPPFMYVVPNTNDDMHSGTYAAADSWLKTQLAKVFATRWYAQSGVVVLTWDEGETGGDRIATIVIASRLAGRGKSAGFGSHFGLLRSLDEIYAVGYLGKAASATSGDIEDLL